MLLRLSRWVRRDRRRRIKMMWDYEAFPLWEVGDVGPWSEYELPISEALRRDLQTWSDDKSNVTLPPTYEAPAEWMEPWDRRGRELLERVREELGPDFQVGYFNEATGKVEWKQHEGGGPPRGLPPRPPPGWE